MKSFFINILALLSVSAAVCSCAMASGDLFDNRTSGRILITGTVSELDSAKPLKDIRITFKAYPASNPGTAPVFAYEVFSGDDGVYVIDALSDVTPLLCTIIAEDISSVHESQTHEISVTWSGPSYDRKSNSFIVNDSHFQLSRIRLKSF